MTPEVDQILARSAAQLMGSLAPLLPAGYEQGQGSLIGILMTFGAQEYERAADIRARENADMRTLFAELAPRVTDSTLREGLLAAAATGEESLAISALNAANAKLRTLLIAVQTHLESRDEARDACARIWDLLKRAAARRLLKLG